MFDILYLIIPISRSGCFFFFNWHQDVAGGKIHKILIFPFINKKTNVFTQNCRYMKLYVLCNANILTTTLFTVLALGIILYSCIPIFSNDQDRPFFVSNITLDRACLSSQPCHIYPTYHVSDSWRRHIHPFKYVFNTSYVTDIWLRNYSGLHVIVVQTHFQMCPMTSIRNYA